MTKRAQTANRYDPDSDSYVMMFARCGECGGTEVTLYALCDSESDALRNVELVDTDMGVCSRCHASGQDDNPLPAVKIIWSPIPEACEDDALGGQMAEAVLRALEKART